MAAVVTLAADKPYEARTAEILDTLEAETGLPSTPVHGGRRYVLEDAADWDEAVAILREALSRVAPDWADHIGPVPP